MFLDDPESAIAVWPRYLRSHMPRCAELYAGGFGGWSYALRHIAKEDASPMTVGLAVDTDMQMAELYSRNHDSQTVRLDKDLREDIEIDPKKDILFFQTRIQDSTWYHWCVLKGTEIFLASPPCPAWSNATTGKKGYLRSDGQEFINLARASRMCQPVAVLIENVPGFKQSDQFNFSQALMKWAGYELCWSHMNDLADVSCSKRERWFGLYVRKDIHPADCKQSWFPAFDCSIHEFGLLEMAIPEHVLRAFHLTPDEIQTYGKIDLFSKASRIAASKLPDDTARCFGRLIDTSKKLSCFMAWYRQQHALPEEKTQDKGIFAELMDDHGAPRFISPFEIAMCYAIDEIHIPSDWNLAYKALGNAVSPLQAVYAIRSMEVCIGLHAEAVPMNSVLKMLEYRLKPSQAEIIPLKDCWLLKEKESACLERECETPKSKRTKTDREVSPTVIEATPTEHFEIDEAVHEEKQDTHSKIATSTEVRDSRFINVSLLLPFEVITTSQESGCTPEHVMKSLGFDSAGYVFQDIVSGHMMTGKPLTHDTTVHAWIKRDEELSILREAFKGTMMTLLEQSAGSPKDEELTVTISYEGKMIWHGILGTHIAFGDVDNQIRLALHDHGIVCPIRWTRLATQINPSWPWKLGELTTSGQLKLHFHFPLIGGGPNKSEDDQLRNLVVAELAGRGVAFNSLLTAVASIFDANKLSQIKKTMNIADPKERWESVLKLAKAANYDLEGHESKKDKAATKIQKMVKKRNLQKPALDVGQLALLPSSFVNQDGTPASVNRNGFCPKGHGIFLANHADIHQWILANKTISADELAVVFPGHWELDTSLPVQHIECQATQVDKSQILFKATLVQFGEKKISPSKLPSANVDCPESYVITITAYKDEFQDSWEQIVHRPGKCLIAEFPDEIQKEAIIAVWGHSFRAQGARCQPKHAESVQLHCRIRAKFLTKILKYSGHNHVYVVPKEQTSSRPDTQFAVLWVGTERFQAELKSKDIPNELGIVRNKTVFGIRTRFDDFESCWSTVFPNRPSPKQVRIQQLHKLQNVPLTFTQVELRAWLDGLEWDAKPIKRLGAGAWLVGSTGKPPRLACQCNNQTVLIEPVESRLNRDQQTQVLAGRIIENKAVASSSSSKPEPLKQDAWALFRKTNGQPLNTEMDTSHATNREVDGPTTSKLREQDAKIEAMSKKLDDVVMMHTTHTQQSEKLFKEVSSAISQQDGKINQVQQSLDQKLQQYQQKSDQQMHQVKVAIDSSAQNTAEQFKILRDMLMAQSKDPRKARKTGPDCSPTESDHE
eukprot:Skav228927  [mRNA]  locus=scaffold3800:172712:176581:+ [translate_table: standard]